MDISKLKWSTIYYQYFGSYLNGFGMLHSDVDFTILTNSFVNDTETIKFLGAFLNQHKQQSNYKINSISNARIPVIKIVDQQHNVEFDLCINNILGVINTKLLKTYSSLHEKIRQGGILLKLWGKANNVINQQDFSSYAIVIMWLSFLQREYQIPNLQDSKYKQCQNDNLIIKRVVNGTEEVFEIDPFFVYQEEQLGPLRDICRKQLDDVKLSHLLCQYFYYYAETGKLQQLKHKISINKLIPVTLDNLFSISDPFDIKHDPGNKVKNFKNKNIFMVSYETMISDSVKDIEFLFRIPNSK